MVQQILAERPPKKPILDSNGLEVMCLPFFHTSLDSAAAAFHVHVSACSYLSLATAFCVLVCPFSLTRSRVAALKGSQFPSQLFEAQNCHPRSHLFHFICPFSFSFSPLPSVLRVPLLPFHGGNLRRFSTLQVLSVLKWPRSALIARLLRWLRGWQKATCILHLSS